MVRAQLAAKLVALAGALWIVAVVLWGFATGNPDIEVSPVALWLIIAGVAMQLGLRIVDRAARRP